LYVQEAQPIPSKRLYFIDIARSIAILLMLQGHFVDTTLADEFRDEHYLAYEIWSYVRQFTSAVFLTVTGIVFTYLLLNQNSGGYFQNQRIRKGLKRVLELFFWGYLLQPRAFHVLQCIGIGLLLIMLLYGISLLIKKVPLSWYFFLAAVALFASNLYFGALKSDVYWPEKAPEFVQNIFHGPTSVFPITPYLGFTLFGAFLGSILVGIKEKIHSWKFIIPSFFSGLLLVLFSKPFLIYLNELPGIAPFKLYLLDWIFLKIGMVLLVLSLLISAEAFWFKNLQNNLFLKLGQNTLSIFIIHMFILYGPGIRYSIQKYFDHGVNALWIAPAVLSFVLFFVLYVYVLDRYRSHIQRILKPVKSRTNWLFGIKD
jgi:uncharacterized membrane protein